MPPDMDTPWRAFRSDLAASLGVWWKEPRLALWTLVLAVAIELPAAIARQPNEPGWQALALPVQIVMAGWVGTQRIWYLRAFRGKTMQRGEPVKFTRAFLGPFVALDLLVGVPLGMLTIPLALGRPTGWPVYLAVVTIVVDAFLTFVTPALAYSTHSALEAISIGLRILRDDWPRCAWYALVPALAIILINRSLPRSSLAVIPAAAIGTTAWMLNLWFKGATAAYYLRGHVVGDDGSVEAR